MAIFSPESFVSQCFASATKIPTFSEEDRFLKRKDDRNDEIMVDAAEALENYKAAYYEYNQNKQANTSLPPPTHPRFDAAQLELTRTIVRAVDYQQEFKIRGEEYQNPQSCKSCLLKVNRTAVSVMQGVLFVVSVGLIVLTHMPSDKADNLHDELISNKSKIINDIFTALPFILYFLHSKTTEIKEAAKKTREVFNEMYNFSTKVANQAKANLSFINYVQNPTDPKALEQAIVSMDQAITTMPPNPRKRKVEKQKKTTSKWQAVVSTVTRRRPLERQANPTVAEFKRTSTSITNRKVLKDLCQSYRASPNTSPSTLMPSSSSSGSEGEATPRQTTDITPPSPHVNEIVERVITGRYLDTSQLNTILEYEEDNATEAPPTMTSMRQEARSAFSRPRPGSIDTSPISIAPYNPDEAVIINVDNPFDNQSASTLQPQTSPAAGTRGNEGYC